MTNLSTSELRTWRIGVIPSQPYVSECYQRKSCHERGLAIDIAISVCELMRLTCTFIERHDVNFGSKDDSGNWSGAIGDIANGYVDTYMPVISPSAERAEVLQFSAYYLYSDVLLVTRLPPVRQSFYSGLFRLFQFSVWCAFAASQLLVMMLEQVAVVLLKHRPAARLLIKQRNKTRRMTGRSASTTSDDQSTTVRSKTQTEHLSMGQSMIAVLQWLTQMLVIGVISSINVSQQLVTRERFPFHDLPTFIDCLERGECRMATYSKSVSYVRLMIYLNHPTSNRLRSALEKYPLQQLPLQDTLHRISESDGVYLTAVLTEALAAYLMKRSRNHMFYAVPTSFSNVGTFAARKGDRMLEQLDRLALLFREHGFTDHLDRRYGLNFDEFDRDKLRLMERSQSVRLNMLRDLFVIWSAGLASAVVSLMFELIRRQWIGKKSKSLSATFRTANAVETVRF